MKTIAELRTELTGLTTGIEGLQVAVPRIEGESTRARNETNDGFQRCEQMITDLRAQGASLDVEPEVNAIVSAKEVLVDVTSRLNAVTGMLETMADGARTHPTPTPETPA